MEFHINLYSLIDIFTVFQGLIFGVIFLLHSDGREYKKFLGLYLISFSLESLSLVITEVGWVPDNITNDFLPFNFYLLSAPLLYLYAKALTRTIDWKKDYRHLIPGVFEFVYMGLIYLLLRLQIWSEDTAVLPWLFYIYLGITLVFMIGYSFKVFLFIRKHRRRANQYYSNVDGKNLNWLFRVAILNIMLGVSTMLVAIITWSSSEWMGDLLNSLLTITYVIWISVGGLRQHSLHEAWSKKTVSELTEPIEEQNDDFKSEFEKITKMITTRKLFSEYNLTLHDLAGLCNIPDRSVSKAINIHHGSNFNQFINSYRVAEAKRLLHDEEYQHMSMEGIGESAGFNSRATFYAAFKKTEGCSPNEFRKRKLMAS